jgi:hypothetical protein
MNVRSGIIFETDLDTKKRYVRIDFDQYGKAMMPFLEQIGLVDVTDDFWKEYATAVTGHDLRKRMYQRIDAWKWNNTTAFQQMSQLRACGATFDRTVHCLD